MIVPDRDSLSLPNSATIFWNVLGTENIGACLPGVDACGKTRNKTDYDIY